VDSVITGVRPDAAIGVDSDATPILAFAAHRMIRFAPDTAASPKETLAPLAVSANTWVPPARPDETELPDA
jgi:hypothetical protein